MVVTFCAVKSNVLLGWLIGLGNVEVLEPEDVKEKMIALLDKIKIIINRFNSGSVFCVY